MALDHLLAALERDAAETADRLVAEALAEASRLDARSTEEVARRREAEVARVAEERRATMEREIAGVRRRSRGEALAARARFLDRFEAALRREFPTLLARPEYLAELREEIAQGIGSFAGEGGVTVRCPGTLEKGVRNALPKEGRVELAVDEGVGNGFRLVSGDGALEVEDTLEGRLAARRDALAREALQLVGGAP